MPGGTLSVAGGANGLADGVPRGAEPGNDGLLLHSFVPAEGTVPNSYPRIDAGKDTSLCYGDAIRLKATGGTSYSWFPATGLDNPRIADPVASPTQTTAYIVTGRNASGCYSSDTITVTVRSRPRITITVIGSVVLCQGDSMLIDAGTGFHGYLWNNGETTQQVMIHTAGSYSVTVTDSMGCTWRSEAIDVTVRMPPVPRIVPGDSLWLCAGESRELDAGAYASYRWSNGERSRRITVSAPGDYWVDVVDSNGCRGMSQQVVLRAYEWVPPEIVPGDTVTICPGDSVELHLRGRYRLYEWRDVSRGAVLGTDALAVIREAGAYEVAVQDSNGCRGVSQVVVVQVSTQLQPHIDVGGSLIFCQGDSVALDAGAEYARYRWFHAPPGADADSVEVGLARRIIAREAGRYWVAVESGSGCSGISRAVELQVMANPLPVITVLGDSVVCQGDSVLLDAGDHASYRWSNGDTTRTILVGATGSYSVVVGNALGCLARSADLPVRFSPLPTPGIQALGDTVFCQGDSVVLAADAGYARYLWSNGETSERIVVRETGSYHVMVASSSGCEGSSRSVGVHVHARPSEPELSQQGDTLISTTGESYQWYRNGEVMDGERLERLVVVHGGEYYVEHSNAAGCRSRSAPIHIGGDPGETDIVVVDAEGGPGDSIVVVVELAGMRSVPPGGARRFTAELAYSGRMLRAESQDDVTELGNGEQMVRIEGERSEGLEQGVLLRVGFRVLLGDALSTRLRLIRFQWEDTGGESIVVNRRDGEFRLRDICFTGPVRLLRNMGPVALKPPTPNPASDGVTFEFELVEHGPTRLSIVDLLGRRVATVIEGDLPPGRYDGRFDLGQLASGTYYCVLETPTDRQSRELVVKK